MANSQNPSIGNKRRAAGGGSYLLALSPGLPEFPFAVDPFPQDTLRQNANFAPLAVSDSASPSDWQN